VLERAAVADVKGCVLLVSLALVVASPLVRAAAPSEVDVQTESLRITFALAGGEPTRWEACHPTCAAPQTREEFGGSSNTDSTLAYSAERRDDATAIVLELVSEPLAGDIVLRKTWRIPRRGYESSLTVSIEGGGAEAFVSAHPLGLAIEPRGEFFAVDLDTWRGVRSRFWTLLARRDTGAPALEQTFRVYSGPIELGTLRATDPALAALLFAHLWFWMRWLAFGLLLLLDGLCGLIGNAGVAIVLLAVCVKILMRPLSALAERWQRDVNEMHSRLQPKIEAIKASSRAAERSERLLALHREHGVSPFFGLKSLLSVAIQIPIFFAAYHALDESFVLDGVSFLWIANLAEPDGLAAFPFLLPFFGDRLNLLPFVMSAVTLLSSRLHDDGTLAPKLLRRQRLGLYAMALAFFLLFYSFPAGMVLYWTSNNLIALVWEAISRRLPRWRDRTGRLAIGTIRR
jgi:YidC/Oxa1 family membrane protein insertase